MRGDRDDGTMSQRLQAPTGQHWQATVARNLVLPQRHNALASKFEYPPFRYPPFECPKDPSVLTLSVPFFCHFLLEKQAFLSPLYSVSLCSYRIFSSCRNSLSVVVLVREVPWVCPSPGRPTTSPNASLKARCQASMSFVILNCRAISTQRPS